LAASGGLIKPAPLCRRWEGGFCCTSATTTAQPPDTRCGHSLCGWQPLSSSTRRISGWRGRQSRFGRKNRHCRQPFWRDPCHTPPGIRGPQPAVSKVEIMARCSPTGGFPPPGSHPYSVQKKRAPKRPFEEQNRGSRIRTSDACPARKVLLVSPGAPTPPTGNRGPGCHCRSLVQT
jgi:hypothetical protein